MKKLLSLLFVFTLFSCSSSDDSGESNSSSGSILGTWRRTNVFMGKQEYVSECDKKTNWTFNIDKSCRMITYEAPASNCVEVNNGLINYDYASKILTTTNPTGGINHGLFQVKYNVISISDSSLKIEAYYEIDGENPEGIIPENERYTYQFVKVQ